MFGNQPLETKLTSLAEQIRSDFTLLEGRHEDPIGAPCQQPGEIGFAQAQWQLTHIFTVEREAIEGIQLNLGFMLARMQPVEIGHAIDTEQHRLAVNDE